MKTEFAVAKAVKGREIKNLREKLRLTQAEYAGLIGVSKKTVERWEGSEGLITGPIVTLMKLLNNYPEYAAMLKVPERIYPLRLYYMFNDDICTIIDVDDSKMLVRICNYARDYQFRAFGREEHPTYEQYEEFLESRCFPRSRDKMKIELERLNIPFYDPFLIIEKTEGRMAEDDFWLKIERKKR